MISAVVVFGALAIFFVGTFEVAKHDERAVARRRRVAGPPTPRLDTSSPWHPGRIGLVDVTLLRFAIDGGVRSRYGDEIAAIEAQSRFLTAEARATRLREIARLLRTMRHGWRYVGA